MRPILGSILDESRRPTHAAAELAVGVYALCWTVHIPAAVADGKVPPHKSLLEHCDPKILYTNPVAEIPDHAKSPKSCIKQLHNQSMQENSKHVSCVTLGHTDKIPKQNKSIVRLALEIKQKLFC